MDHKTALLDESVSEILEGLHEHPRRIASKFFYDKTGSRLFHQITGLDEYYLTRSEKEVLQENMQEISWLIGENAYMIDLGSGNHRKSRFLLRNLIAPAAYAAVDISTESLFEQAEQLSEYYRGLEILPVVADDLKPSQLPEPMQAYRRKIVFFPGSSFGNYDGLVRDQILRSIAEIAGPDGGLLIGIDLKKDVRILEAAYNDSKGITALFNLNLLSHLNRRFAGNFRLERWEHVAFYNKDKGRIEMHLFSLAEQEVEIAGVPFSFARGETICTEYAYKYEVREFEEIIYPYFRVEKSWTDENHLFSLQLLSVR